MNTQHIIPAIIPETSVVLQQRLQSLRNGDVVRVQVDVMDGTYTQNITWPYTKVERESFLLSRRRDSGVPYWQEFEIEVDLLVSEPEHHIASWALSGVASVIAHIESTHNMEEVFTLCAKHRMECAVALKPSTDIECLAPYVSRATFVQCMGNDKVGYHGVPLDPKAVDTIHRIHTRWPHVVIGVDIGVKEETIPTLVRAGATRFASGSAVFSRGTPLHDFERLEVCTKQALSECA